MQGVSGEGSLAGSCLPFSCPVVVPGVALCMVGGFLGGHGGACFLSWCFGPASFLSFCLFAFRLHGRLPMVAGFLKDASLEVTRQGRSQRTLLLFFYFLILLFFGFTSV